MSHPPPYGQHPQACSQHPRSAEGALRARSPVLGIVSIPLALVGGVGLLWASAEGTAGDLIGLIGRTAYNPARAGMFCLLVLGTTLGIIAMRTRRGRWWGLAGVIIGGGLLLLIIVLIVLVMLLFAVVGGILTS